MNENVAEVMK